MPPAKPPFGHALPSLPMTLNPFTESKPLRTPARKVRAFSTTADSNVEGHAGFRADVC